MPCDYWFHDEKNFLNADKPATARNFRCFEGVSVDIGPAFNLFLGANGEGKTTILEAACVLLRLQSQRSSSLVPVIQINKKFFEVRGGYDEHELEFRFSALRRPGEV